MPISPVWNLYAIKAANQKAGFHFFDVNLNRIPHDVSYPDSVRQGPGGIYLVSLRHDADGYGIFGVFSFNPATGEVRAVRGHQAFVSKRGACRAATRIAQLAP